MISPICVFQLSSRRQSPFPAPQCFAQSRRRLLGGHGALAPAGYITTAKHVHHVEPSFTTLRKWHVQRLIHRLANDRRRSQTFSEVVERNGRLNVMRSACAAVRIGEAGADGKKCGIDAELNDEGQE
jgi:hypothetical protein